MKSNDLLLHQRRVTLVQIIQKSLPQPLYLKFTLQYSNEFERRYENTLWRKNKLLRENGD